MTCFYRIVGSVLFLTMLQVSPEVALTQDRLPADNGIVDYHVEPRWRESESHPLRVLAYAVHPIGWLARELVFRPLSYFASSTETTRSVMGYREPYDYRQPECFSGDDSSPDCRTLSPFNYDRTAATSDETETEPAVAVQNVYFPDVNFDFNKRTLNPLGLGKVRQIAETLKKSPIKVVLEGHTDYIGSDAYNQKLGMDRAEAVKAELVKLGVDQMNLSAVTFGESRPLIDEKTDYARSVNRRVNVQSE